MRIPRLGLLAAAFLWSASAFAEVRSLTILHTNDLHARLTPLENGNGGFAYLAAALKRERAGCKDCILLNAGDLVQGSPVSTIFHGLPVYEVANLLGFDASTLGNHEFDYGWPQAKKFLQTARFPIVSANIENTGSQPFTEKPYVILNVNGLRVAVVGAMTDSLKTLTTPKLLGTWHTTPVVETARKRAREVRDRADLVVLLAHITGEEENAFLDDAPEFPVLVTGHIHRGIDQALTHNGRVLVRVRGYGEEFGRLELKVDTEKKAPVAWEWKRILVDSKKIAPDPEVAKLVKHWEGEVTARVDSPLAVSKRAFTNREVKEIIERAMREQTGANFAFMNLGGVRDRLPEGQLLVRHIWNIMPFDNTVVVGTFKGRELPPAVLGGRTVEPDREYTLAVSDYTAANQEGRDSLGVKGLKFPNEVGLMRDLLVDWFRKKKVIE
jgi:2',3'-cyclic-nucleotide 2'-phosphodiesterase (5'-nucleotidase family)